MYYYFNIGHETMVPFILFELVMKHEFKLKNIDIKSVSNNQAKMVTDNDIVFVPTPYIPFFLR